MFKNSAILTKCIKGRNRFNISVIIIRREQQVSLSVDSNSQTSVLLIPHNLDHSRLVDRQGTGGEIASRERSIF